MGDFHSASGDYGHDGEMPKKYRTHLSPEERLELTAITAGKAAATKRKRAQILLASDENHPEGALHDEDIARALNVGISTVERTRRSLFEHGLTVAVQGWPVHRKVPQGMVDGWMEAHLIAAACGAPPEGRSRWTLRLLGDQLIGLGLVETISPQTVSRTLKKTNLSLGR